MQLKCKECGHTFEDNETATQYNLLTAAESDDSYTGDPCCPYCGSAELAILTSRVYEVFVRGKEISIPAISKEKIESFKNTLKKYHAKEQ
jgi:Zn finger protein HypA/HybF involved in hydrogenase expression